MAIVLIGGFEIMNAFKHFRMVALALTALMGYQSAAQAAYVDTYFAFNNLGSELGVMSMLTVTYQGAAGVETVVLPTLLPGGYLGMPDNGRNPATSRGLTFPEAPDPAVGGPGGDGASTRLPLDLTVSINWDTTTIPLIPTITILSFTFDNRGTGSAVATMQTPYVIGLIPYLSETVPGHLDTELASFIGGPLQGDIYPFADTMGSIGNPVGEALAPALASQLILVSFAAAAAEPFAAVPIPAAVWLFGSAIGVLGWARRKAAVA